MELDGWHPDPFRIHEERFIKDGDATPLVRDSGIGSYAEPPGALKSVLSPPAATPSTGTFPPLPATPAPVTVTGRPSPPPPANPSLASAVKMNGWHPDPFRIHEERFLKDGEATALVRDNGIGSYAEPPGSAMSVSSPPIATPPPAVTPLPPATPPPPPATPAPASVIGPPSPTPTASTDGSGSDLSERCHHCGAALRPGTKTCENCGAQQGSETGWFPDPAGRWGGRYFDNGQMTNQVRVVGCTYLESKRNFADIDESRIEAILINGERLLHEVWVYNDKRGILALTSFRALKYHTGRGDRSTRRGAGSLTLHWELVWNPQYLDQVRKSANTGQGGAPDHPRTGVKVLTGYESGPFKQVGSSDPELVGSKTITLWQRLEIDKDQGPPETPGAVKGTLRSAIRLNRRLGKAFRRHNQAATETGDQVGSVPARVEDKALELQLVGRTPALLRIDELLTAAAAAAAAK